MNLQANTLRAFGVRALLFSFSGDPAEEKPDHIHIPLIKGVSKEKQIRQLIDRIYQSGVDVVYVRRELWHPSYRRLMRTVPTVAEINTLERAEFKQTMPLLRRLYAQATSFFWNSCPAGYVSVTHELAASAPKRKPCAVISNGIAEPAAPGNSTRDKPHLFFSGTGSYSWHGIDKFVEMARMFPQWDFSFAGELPEVHQQNLPPNFRSHGKLPAAEADQLLTLANIGVGTLALHRKDMVEACPLKLRSYLAYGLPSIIGYKDTDFSNGYPFICQLDNTERNISDAKDKIANFVLANYKKRIPWSEVSFASESEKARMRCQFLTETSQAWRRKNR